MATVNFLVPVNMDDHSTAPGFITAASSTLIRIDDNPNPADSLLRQEYGGNYTLNSSGGILGGTITSHAEYTRPNTGATLNQTLNVTGLNHDVGQAAGVLLQGSVVNWFAFLYQHDDVFIGSSGNDVIRAFNGNDHITGGGGNDLIDGGFGLDTAFYSGNRAQYTLSFDGNYTISGPDGTDTLIHVERLQFADRKVAIDLTTGQAANNTVKMIGALFGPEHITAHPDYVTVGLQLFDAGMTMQQVAQLALGTPAWLAEAGSSSNTAFVNTVYENVVGSAPGDAERALYVNMLDTGTSTQADLLVFAANHAVNELHINLAGLQQSGVDFA